MLLTLMRPDDIDDDAVLFPFIDKCQELARDERLTLGFLTFRRDRNTILEEDGGGFPRPGPSACPRSCASTRT
ncbi:MAG: hypothetical protein IPL61_27495 [Myxococcales bacterium]|nr:hypothetical protein [Myxococcales bacterium]